MPLRKPISREQNSVLHYVRENSSIICIYSKSHRHAKRPFHNGVALVVTTSPLASLQPVMDRLAALASRLPAVADDNPTLDGSRIRNPSDTCRAHPLQVQMALMNPHFHHQLR
jgi:hypothetical protein